VNVPVITPLIVAEEAIELLAPIVFIPTLSVDPEDDIEETPFISIWPTAETVDGPECKDTALTVNDGTIDKLADADKLLDAVIKETEPAVIDALEASVELPSLVTKPTALDVPEQLKEETPALVTIAKEETEPLPDIDDVKRPDKTGLAETEAELFVEEVAPISTKPVEGAEPVLVIKLAAPSSRIPTSVVEAEAERLADTCISCEAELDTEPTALRLVEPVKVSVLTSGIAEIGNSLIAPKPSIKLPYL